MKIKDRPEYNTKPKPLTVSPDTTVLDAVKQMTDKNFGSVVVVNADQTVAGMMTERDIFKRLVAEQRDASTTKVGDIMTAEVRTAQEDDDLVSWLRIMSNERFRRLPVVDEHGRLKNILTQGDFVSYTWPQLMNQATTLLRGSFANSYQIWAIIGGVMIYTLLLALVVGLF